MKNATEPTKHDERDPEVEPLPEEVARRVDPQRLLERAERRVDRDVEREEPRPLDREAPVDPEQEEDAEDVPDELVEEGRVVQVRVAVLPWISSAHGSVVCLP